MTIVRQLCLFDMQELYDLEPTQRYNEIFSTTNIDSMVSVVAKQSNRGRPSELNYAAMIQSLIVRYVERIPETKLLIKRLEDDTKFKVDCGFLVSDTVPSEASYSRVITKLGETHVLEEADNQIVQAAVTEGFIDPNPNVAVDGSHFTAKDQATYPKAEKPKPKPQPKKRGRKSKKEREQWLKEKEAYEASLPIYEKTIENQIEVPYHVLRDEMPREPSWGYKQNSEGRKGYWYGYKGHFAVETKSQFILSSLMSTAKLNDAKAAIPLLKGIQERLPSLNIRYSILDKGYDFKAIYEYIHRIKSRSIIAHRIKHEPENAGFDENFAPTCVREHSYRYDSFDPKYQTLKYTRPKECSDCPLAHDSLCQKVYKVKMEKDLRRYSAPARGSKAWDELYKERTAVERVNAYLKGFFQLDNVRYRSGKRANVHFGFVTLVYNAMKLANLRLKERSTSLNKAV